MKQKLVRTSLKLILPLSLLVLILLTTNPYRLPLVLLVLPFLLILYGTYQFIYIVAGRLFKRTSKKKQQFNAAIFAGGIVTLALLQSIRQLSIRDVIIILILIFSLSFYVKRIDL